MLPASYRSGSACVCVLIQRLCLRFLTQIRPFWLKEGCHLCDTKRFSQEQPHLNAAPQSVFRYSCPVPRNRFPKLNFDAINSAANDLHLCSAFRQCCHLSINLMTSFQYSSELLFFLNIVTYFVLSKQIGMDTLRPTFFSVSI